VARAEGFEPFALSFRYGQRHVVEVDAARRVAAFQGGRQLPVVDVDLGVFGGSALTDASAEVPPGVSYVPARNTVFLSLALGWCEVLGARDVFIGANADDYEGYPDCRPEYFEAFEGVAGLATRSGGRLRVHAPLVSLPKAGVIRWGADLGVDFSLTWSCYNAGPLPCGWCDACVLRRDGFAAAGVEDPACTG
jgi:7-cyano-7-deazaguanine synthase